jgi:ATP-dependent Zn protease
MLRALFLFALLFPILGAGSVLADCPDDAPEALVAENVRVSFVKEQDTLRVATVGTLRNASKRKVENIQVETRHLDAEKRLTDVHNKYLFDVVLKPGDDLAFRLYEPAAQPQSAYVSQQTRVASAEYVCVDESDSTASAPSDDTTWWQKYLMGWLPVWVMIVIMIFSIYRCSGNRSPTMRILGRQIKHMEQQDILKNALIERIAQALEERNKS